MRPAAKVAFQFSAVDAKLSLLRPGAKKSCMHHLAVNKECLKQLLKITGILGAEAKLRHFLFNIVEWCIELFFARDAKWQIYVKCAKLKCHFGTREQRKVVYTTRQ